MEKQKEKIDILNFIFNYYEVNSCLQNGKIFMDVVDEISRVFGIDFSLYKNPNSKMPDYALDIEKGLSILYKYVFFSPCQEFIFSLLRSNNYYIKMFIITLIKALGNAKDKIEAEEIIDDHLRLPFIHQISFNGIDEYSIQTDYGDYSFLLADKVLNDQELIEYMGKEDRRNSCHANAGILLEHCDDWFSICSLCRFYFVAEYYHSYGYRKENDKVADLCSNMLIDKRQFDNLYSPREILFMRNDELRKLYLERVKNIENKINKDDILKCGLYMQSLNLDKNPEEKRKVLDFNGVTILH